jgi:hypothetical protein
VYGIEITTCRYKDLPHELVMLCYYFPVIRVPVYSAKVSSWLEPLLHLVDQITFYVFSHTAEQDSQPTTSLISKQIVPYQTRNDACCPMMSTPKIRSLADSSITIYNTRRNPTVPTIQNLVQTTALNLTTVTSHHDRWKFNTHTSQTQYHKDGKTYSITQDYEAKQYY